LLALADPMRIVGLLLILLSIPVLIGWLRRYPRHRKWAYLGIGALPFLISAFNLDAAFLTWPAWPGYAKGIVVSLLDTLAIAILATSRRPLRKLPFLLLFLAYLLAVALSLAVSSLPMSSFFYLSQLVRVLLIFVAVASFAGDPRAIRWLSFGLALGAIFQAVVTIDQRLSGVVQAAGTMGHQNLLGLMLHFVTLPLLALLLAGERSKLIMFGVLAALVAVALGASRGTVGFVAIGVAFLFVLSLARRPTTHKWKIVGLAVVALAIVAPIAMTSFQERFTVRPVSQGSDEERLAFERAAKSMWRDHPMGVGANQYVVVANSQGYSARAGVIWNWASRSANVHNMYLLAAAETGWPGFLTFIALLSIPIIRGLIFAFRNRRDARGEIVLGASVTFMILGLHGLYEWVFVVYHAQYVFAIALGIVAGCIRQMKIERQSQARTARSYRPASIKDASASPLAHASEKSR